MELITRSRLSLVNRVSTSVGIEGTKTATIKLEKGTCRYMCDPHSGQMQAASRVG
jgi:hypothetical protein